MMRFKPGFLGLFDIWKKIVQIDIDGLIQKILCLKEHLLINNKTKQFGKFT